MIRIFDALTEKEIVVEYFDEKIDTLLVFT